jgi:hypothetical protein
MINLGFYLDVYRKCVWWYMRKLGQAVLPVTPDALSVHAAGVGNAPAAFKSRK